MADILKKTGREFHPDVRVMIIPGSQAVYLDALRQGWTELFTMAGAAVSVSTCGPCLGGHMGVLAANEVCVSTSNRNFRGRMGHRDARVFPGESGHCRRQRHHGPSGAPGRTVNGR